MSSIDDILAAVRALPSIERARLMPLLWDQLSAEDWTLPSAAWITEAERRSDLLASNNMSADDWAAVRARAHQKAGLSE